MAKNQDFEIEAMKDFIQSTMEDLGCKISFDADADLQKYQGGEPLTVSELKSLPEDAVVWVWYKEYGEDGPRINGAMRVSSCGDGTYSLNDGSSFGAEFDASGLNDADKCEDEPCGEGEMRLFKAVEIPQKPKRVKKSRKS